MGRISSLFAASLAAVHLAGAAQPRISIGNITVELPVGWREKSRAQDRIVLLAEDGRQQLTLSALTLASQSTFDQFKKLCQYRLVAEQTDGAEVFIEHKEPFDDDGTFGFFFSGEEKPGHRMFSGYLRLSNRTLVTVYLESIGVDAKDHFDSFSALVGGLKPGG